MDKKYIKEIVNFALKEDIASGDITSNLIINDKQNISFEVIAKSEMILCGLEFFYESLFNCDISSCSFCVVFCIFISLDRSRFFN